MLATKILMTAFTGMDTDTDSYHYLNEMEAYIRRNLMILNVPINGKQKRVKTVCSQCFKAHAINVAKNMGLNDHHVSLIERRIQGDVGHDGYYLDNEEVRETNHA